MGIVLVMNIQNNIKVNFLNEETNIQHLLHMSFMKTQTGVIKNIQLTLKKQIS